MGARQRQRFGGPTASGTSSSEIGRDSGSAPGGEAGSSWPVWARVFASLAIAYHMTAVVAGAFGVPPSSDLERGFANLFTPYHDMMDQGYAYRFYAEPPPTPVVTATLEFSDGRPAETVRLPGRDGPAPRMRRQRQLALANALVADYQEAKRASGKGDQSRWARAFAKHLCRANPGCRQVTLHAQYHLIPDMEQIRDELSERGGKPIDLFDDSYFSIPERIGDFPCDAF